jgi:hypothetical protein
MLTMYNMHHPKANIDRLYVKWKEEGEKTGTSRSFI